MAAVPVPLSRVCRLPMLWMILGLCLTLYGSICLVFFVTQRSFIYFPQPGRNREIARITLATAAGQIELAARPTDSPQALLYFGGNAEDVTLTLPELAAAFPGRAIYLMQYRGYGGSTGQPTERGLREDAALAAAFIRERHPQLLLIGRSLGSSLALGLAADQPPEHLVLITPFDSILAIATRIAPWLPMTWLLQDRWESVRDAPRVNCPTLILAATDDEIVPAGNTARLLQAFPEPGPTVAMIEGTDHNSISAAAAFWQVLHQFVATHQPSVADQSP